MNCFSPASLCNATFRSSPSSKMNDAVAMSSGSISSSEEDEEIEG
jgi:hypothetical protein